MTILKLQQILQNAVMQGNGKLSVLIFDISIEDNSNLHDIINAEVIDDKFILDINTDL